MGRSIAVTHSVCRLQQPIQNLSNPLDDPRNFGMGIAKAGLAENADMAWMNQGFRLDRTQSADFQARAIEAMKKIGKAASQKRVYASSVNVMVKPNAHIQATMPDAKPRAWRIYILSPHQLISNAKKFAADQAQGQHTPLTEPTYFKEAVFSLIPKLVGWLELENGFFIFGDYRAFNRSAHFLGIAHQIDAPIITLSQSRPKHIKDAPNIANEPRPN